MFGYLDKLSDEGDDFEQEDLEKQNFDLNQGSDSHNIQGSLANESEARHVSNPQTTRVNSAGPSVLAQDKPASDSKFFAIRTTGGQERIVANMLQAKLGSKKIGIRSILVLDSFKGYIIVEAAD